MKITRIVGISILSLVSGVIGQAADLAKVNGRVITDKDLKSALSGLNEGQRQSVLKDINTRRQIVSSLIDQEVLSQEAEKEKLDQDGQYKEALAAFRKQYLASQVIQKNLGAKLTDAAAKKYYDRNKLKFSTDQVHAQHILLATEAEAREILKSASAKDADFQAMAEKSSKDPSAKNNRGDLGFFGRDRMVPEFTDAAFSGSAGDVIGPVKTAYGYHIIKILEKRTGKALEFDEVELRVKNELRQELVQGYVSQIKKSAKIEIDDKSIEKL